MKKNRMIFVSLTALALMLVFAFLFTTRVEAAPAAPVEYTLTQPDGRTTFTARQWGDEWNHGVETVTGYSIYQMDDSWWVYAEPQADGLLGPALSGGEPLRVGIDDPNGLPLHLRPSVLRDNPYSPAAMNLTSPSLNGPQAPALTNIKTLVLLADFNDVTTTYTAASFQSLFFSTTSSSVRKFYREISFNNADIIPAEETCGTDNNGITDWTDLGYAHPNTGSSTGLANQQLVKDLLIASDSCIVFSDFDTNGNGYIDSSELQIIVVVAGYERSYSDAYSPSIWAHAWNLDWAGAPTLDGKIVGDGSHGGYAQFGERHGTHQATIGIMAHEFGHAINWPDLYDIDYSSQGIGQWSIMAGGSWNSTSVLGDSPAHADAWLKWYQGWITPTAVSGTLNDVSIAQAETNPVAYLLRPNAGGVDWLFGSHSGTGEYFLVENREYSGYDAGLPGCGLMIWHIDESVTSTNSANANESHPLVWLEQADGLNSLYYGGPPFSDAGDPYPGSSTNYSFNNATNPNSNLYSGSASSASVHVESTSCSSSMIADLTYSGTPPPSDFTKTSPANTAMGQNTALTLNWDDATNASDYDYCLETPVNGTCNTWTVGLVTSQADVSGLASGTSYEWQVRANNSGGSTLANSGIIWTFTTAGSVGDAYEEDDDFSQAKPIVSGIPQTHSIVPIGDYDYVTFTLGVESSIILETSGSVWADTYLYLYDESHVLIESNDDYGTDNYSYIERACDVNALPAGTFFAMVRDFGNDGEIAEYQLSFTASPCGGSGDIYEDDDIYTDATPIASGETQTHSIVPVGDIDWITFTLAAPSGISLVVSGPNPTSDDSYMELYDGAGEYLTNNDDIDFPDNLYSGISYDCADPLTADTYYAYVEELGGNSQISTYDLTLVVTPCMEYDQFNYLPLVMKPGTAPGAFNKISPTDGSSSQPVDGLVLDWSDSSGVDHYAFCAELDNNGSCDSWYDLGTTSQVSLSSLPNDTTFEWNIKAVSGAYETFADGGTLWHFTTASGGTGTILNGDFELDHTSWSEYSSGGWEIISHYSDEISLVPHSGNYLAWMGGYNNALDYIEQSVTIPAASPYLEFYRWAYTTDISACDYGYVSINSTDVYSYDLYYADSGWTRTTVNLSAYSGQTVNLKFRVETDISNYSGWYIDDVAFSTSAAPPLLSSWIYPFFSDFFPTSRERR